MSRTANVKCFRIPSILALVLISFVLATPSRSETITFRTSGPCVKGCLDPNWTYIGGPAHAPLSATAFTAADFAASLAGLAPFVVSRDLSWLASLACDPLAQWIAVDSNRLPKSMLLGHRFDVSTCCIASASLTFCWAADNYLGDSIAGGANPSGVYLNEVALPIDGGGFSTETSVSIDVTGLVHCGSNEFHVYLRDAVGSVSGAMFTATLVITECTVKTEHSTWGKVKALYR